MFTPAYPHRGTAGEAKQSDFHFIKRTMFLFATAKHNLTTSTLP